MAKNCQIRSTLAVLESVVALSTLAFSVEDLANVLDMSTFVFYFRPFMCLAPALYKVRSWTKIETADL